MKAPQGLYYYPNPTDKKERMYVRENDGNIEFRLWNQNEARFWDEHGWRDYDQIYRSMKMFKARQADKAKKTDYDPLKIYDLELAKFLIKESKKA